MNTFFLLMCFSFLGATAWVLVNAIYAEIPLIVASLDYDYSVISKLTLCITLTSVAPILWAILADSCSTNSSQWVTKVGIAVMLALGTATALGASLSDAALQQTTLLITSVCSGLVGTMANVLYYPHAATTVAKSTTIHQEAESSLSSPPAAVRQTTAMASGIAAASLFLAVLAIVQQRNEAISNSFSLRAYFGVVTGVFGFGILGFVGTVVAAEDSSLSTTSHQTSLVNNTVNDEESNENDDVHGSMNDKNNYGSIEIPNTDNNLHRRKSTNVSTRGASSKLSDAAPDVDGAQTTVSHAAFEIQEEAPPADENDHDDDHDHSSTSPSFFASFLTVSKRHATINGGQFLLNLLTFFLPGIVPYSIQNFEDSQRALHYMTVTQLIAQTLGAVASGWKQSRSVAGQLIVFGILWIPTVVLSFVNNTDFQHASQRNSAVPITLNALLNFAYGYSSTVFYHLVHAAAAAVPEGEATNERGGSSGSDPHIASRVLGSWNQLGAMIGSLIAFFLVENGAIS
jgi:hypothetical protein